MSNIIDSIQLSGTVYTLSAQTSGGGNPTVELTQAQYDALVTAGTVQADTYYIITDAQAGDLTNYYTKTEVDNAITAATATKQDTLVSGTNIKTINNESILGSGNITIQGGGKAVSGGRGITVTSGETADTVSFNLNIGNLTGNSNSNIAIFGYIYGTGNTANSNTVSSNASNSLLIGDYNHINGGVTGSFQNNMLIGSQNNLTDTQGGWGGQGNNLIAGEYNVISGNRIKDSTAFGSYNTGYTNNVFVSGNHNECRNEYETALGRYNTSNTGSTNADKTLFSVGNGTANARHNAFEIRKNGDIYITSGGTDIKLQDNLGGGGSSYTAGTGIDITNDVISVTGVVETSAITTSITSSSTDAQVPSAKAVYDIVGDIETLLSQI